MKEMNEEEKRDIIEKGKAARQEQCNKGVHWSGIDISPETGMWYNWCTESSRIPADIEFDYCPFCGLELPEVKGE